jgi:low affinity Fe/Cu permease
MKKKNGRANDSPYRSHELFRVLSTKTAHSVGHPWAFALALGIVVVWAITGPIFGFSDTWQLVINTGTTIITFLMVFLIQNTQNRDSHALHLKLDELIRAQDSARNRFINLEDMSDAELDELQEEFNRIAREKQRRSRDSHEPTRTSSSGVDSGRTIPREA